MFPRPFGDYELLGEIARGGMGVVYRASEPALKREVALKMILSGQFASRTAVDRFRAEANAAASLQHPNIVAIHRVGEEEGQPYFTMDLIDGSDLADLTRSGPLPPKQSARYIKEVAEAIQHSHERGVLHRDLKPSNVLIDAFGQPRITDFGLAKQLSGESGLTATGQALGSPNYMAPEQALRGQGEISASSDIYSLGALLYHLVVGRAPFASSTVAETLQQLAHKDPPSPRVLNPSVPVDLETISLKCLQKEPSRRYSSAQAVAEELGRFLRGEPILAHPVGRVERAWRWCGRNRSLAAALAAAGVALALGLGGVLWQWHRAEQSDGRTRLHLYAADVLAASQALDRGDLGHGRRLLEAHIPDTGEEDLRGFEWRYLWQRCQGQQQATLAGHTRIVTCTAFSPDGRVLATGSQDGTVCLWHWAESRLIASLRVSDRAVWTVGFSPESDWLVTGGSDGRVRIWDVATQQPIRSIAGQMAAVAPTGSVMAVNSGSPLFWEPPGTITVWNYRAGRQLLELPERGKGVALSADGKLLAEAGPSSGIRLWAIPSAQLVRTIETEGPVWSLAFSPTRSHLLAGSHRAAFVWNLADPVKPLKRVHPLTVWSAGFSPDGNTIVTACSDRIVRVWETTSMNLNRVLSGHADEVWCATFSVDGKSLATGSKDRTVKIWSTELGTTDPPMPHTLFEKPFFSADGSRLATNIRTNEQAHSILWQVTSRSPLSVSPGGPVVGFHPDDHQLFRLSADRRALELWSPETSSGLRATPPKFEPSELPIVRVGSSSNLKLMFAIGAGGLVSVIDVSTSHSVNSFRWMASERSGAGSPKIRSAALTADGRRFAISTEEENAVQLFDVKSGRETKLEGHRDFVSGMSFSPDGRLLASASVDATIKLWDVPTGKELATLTGHMEEATDVAFSPDGRTFASMGHLNCVKFWHVATRREVMSLSFPNAGYHLCFSPDGRHLAVTIASGNQTESVQILSAATLNLPDR